MIVHFIVSGRKKERERESRDYKGERSYEKGKKKKKKKKSARSLMELPPEETPSGHGPCKRP